VPRTLGFPIGLSFVPAKSRSQCVSGLRHRHHRRWRAAADFPRQRSDAAVGAAAGRLRGKPAFLARGGIAVWHTKVYFRGGEAAPKRPNRMCS
jgi:hypothetical protein